MSFAAEYFSTLRRQIDRVGESQWDAIERAGTLCGDVLSRGRWIYVFGTGHSHMLAEELFYRAGGLARIRPILYPPLMLHESASQSTEIERDASNVEGLLRDYPLESGDLLLIASNSGRNPVPVELALRVRAIGVKVVGLVNRAHSESFASRHESGKRLAEVVDVVIDNCGVAGDACVPIAEGAVSIGAASTVTGALIVQMIACWAVESALLQGWTPELFSSSNAGQESQNDALLDRYRNEIRHL